VILAIVKITPLVLLVIAGAFAVSGENLRWQSVPTVLGIGQTAVLLFFAFMGVEGGLNASGEVANPARTVPRAILLALTSVAMLYIGLQVVAQGMLGSQLPRESAPLVATAGAIFGDWGARLFVLVTVFSVSGFLSADMLGSPRVFYAMAERGQMPRRLSAVHPRLKTPALAIGVYSLMCAVISTTGSFRQLVVVAASGTAVAYLICCLGLLSLRRRNVTTASAPFVARGGALVPIGAAAIIAWMLSTLSGGELAAAASLVAVSGIVYTVQSVLPGRKFSPGQALPPITSPASPSQRPPR
jgi:amino acid transporter